MFILKRIDQNLRLCGIVDLYWSLARLAYWLGCIGVLTAVVRRVSWFIVPKCVFL